MTLTTHAVTGALIGAIAADNLALAAVAGFASHFLFDTIPHWDYKLGATQEDKKNPLNNTMKIGGKQFFIDLAKIGFDFWLGMILVFIMAALLPWPLLVASFVGAVCAVIPDPLQFVYWKLRPRFMAPLQRFHIFMHARTKLSHKPFIGITSQAIIILITMYLYKLLFVV